MYFTFLYNTSCQPLFLARTFLWNKRYPMSFPVPQKPCVQSYTMIGWVVKPWKRHKQRNKLTFTFIIFMIGFRKLTLLQERVIAIGFLVFNILEDKFYLVHIKLGNNSINILQRYTRCNTKTNKLQNHLH